MTDEQNDIWGNKFWDCELANEMKRRVDVCYMGSFTDVNGTRGFNSHGQCKVRSSKASLSRDWDIRIIKYMVSVNCFCLSTFFYHFITCVI